MSLIKVTCQLYCLNISFASIHKSAVLFYQSDRLICIVNVLKNDVNAFIWLRIPHLTIIGTYIHTTYICECNDIINASTPPGISLCRRLHSTDRTKGKYAARWHWTWLIYVVADEWGNYFETIWCWQCKLLKIRCD